MLEEEIFRGLIFAAVVFKGLIALGITLAGAIFRGVKLARVMFAEFKTTGGELVGVIIAPSACENSTASANSRSSFSESLEENDETGWAGHALRGSPIPVVAKAGAEGGRGTGMVGFQASGHSSTHFGAAWTTPQFC